MSLAMTKQEREQFLAGVHIGIVSIPAADRGPLTVPIWYDYTPGADLWMITNRNSKKGKLLESAARISLCAQTESPPYCYVSVEGAFSVRETTKDELLHMATRYLGETEGQAYAAASESAGDSIIVSLQIESWLTVDYSKR